MVWQSKPLGEVITKTRTIDPRKKPDTSFYYVDVSGVSNAKFEIVEANKLLGKDAPSRARRVISEGNVIFATVRPTLKRIAIVPNYLDGEVCSTGYFVFEPNGEIYNRFLYYFLQSDYFIGEMEKVQAGASYPAVNDSQVKGVLIHYPSIPEQKRIVAILDQAFADIDKARTLTEQNLKNARELFESYLQQVCTRNEESWKKCLVGDVCDLFQGLAINQKTKHLLVEKSSLPLLRIKDLRNRTFEKYVAEEGYPEKSRAYKDDIIYTRTGQIGLVFKGFEGILHNNSFKVVPNKEISKDYLFWWLQHSQFRDVVIGLASRAAQPDITHALFKKQEIIVPSLEYQIQSVELIENLSTKTKRLEAIYLHKLTSLEAIKKSLLQKAFNGELAKDVEAA